MAKVKRVIRIPKHAHPEDYLEDAVHEIKEKVDAATTEFLSIAAQLADGVRRFKRAIATVSRNKQ